ncbi:hypothetical protein DSECCO2_586480 [anaerobic digester metagenome]
MRIGFKYFLQFVDVNVSLEWVQVFGIESFVDGAIDGMCLTEFDMTFCGIEMRIAWYNIAFFYEC